MQIKPPNRRYRPSRYMVVTPRCLGRALTVLWGIAVSLVGWMLVTHGARRGQNGGAGILLQTTTTQSGNSVFPGLRSPWGVGGNVPPTPPRPGLPREDSWVQKRIHDTKNMFKLPSQLYGIVGQKVGVETTTNNNNNNNAPVIMELPSWAARGDHKLAQSDAFRERVVGWNEDPWGESATCSTFDHSIMRPQHGCQVNKNTLTVFCNFDNLRIDNSKIDMARGGEVLSTVMGRAEAVELPQYERGAFAVPTKPVYEVPMEYRSGLHYLEKVLNAMRYPSENNHYTVDLTCQTTFPGTTLFVTRYEYVNLYHTMTDWWNAYFVMPDDYHDRPHRVVFLDGHAQGNLDPVWKTLFGEYLYIQHLPPGGACFERAVFIPAGYKSPLYTDLKRERCVRRDMAANFSDFVVRQRYHLDHVVPIWGKVVLVDRQPYVSHPRSDPTVVHRQISNMNELADRLARVPGIDLHVVRLEVMPFEEQIRTVREAQVLIANHGAALSHLMFMDETRSHILEFTSEFMDFFEYMARWKGIYHEFLDIDYDGNIRPNRLGTVVRRVEEFLSSKTYRAYS